MHIPDDLSRLQQLPGRLSVDIIWASLQGGLFFCSPLPQPAHQQLACQPFPPLKVKYWHRGEVYRVYGLPSQNHADQAANLLSIKAAFEGGQPLDGLPLRSRAQPFRSDEITEAGRSELAGITFEKMFAQIVDWVKRMRKSEATSYLAPLDGDTPNAVKPTLLYQAAEGRSLVGTRLLLLLDPAAAGRADAPWPGACPLSAACWGDDEQVVELLLQAAPHMARVPDNGGLYPVHRAARSGSVPILRLLLQAAPETAGAAFWGEREVAAEHRALLKRGILLHPTGISRPWIQLNGRTPLHEGAFRAGAVELLLKAAPEAAMQPDRQGRLPLHCAASIGCADAVQLLLAAAPEAALRTARPGFVEHDMQQLRRSGLLNSRRTTRGPRACAPAGCGVTPLHIAALKGRPEVALELLAAAPAAAAVVDHYGCTPLQLALVALADEKVRTSHLWSDHRGAARVLLSTCSMPDAVKALRTAGRKARPLFGDLVAARLPLAEAEWALLPAPCPGLLPALPTALAHSLEQARQLVRRLRPAEKQRLRAAAMRLGRKRQREVGTRLPVAVAQHLLFEQLQE